MSTQKCDIFSIYIRLVLQFSWQLITKKLIQSSKHSEILPCNIYEKRFPICQLDKCLHKYFHLNVTFAIVQMNNLMCTHV